MRADTVRSATLLREARLRAGLSQQELAEVSGRDRTVIARYEQGVVAPSIDTNFRSLFSVATCVSVMPISEPAVFSARSALS